MVFEEKKRHNDDLQKQIVLLMMDMEKQKETLENRIVELQNSKQNLQSTLEKIQTEKEFLENNNTDRNFDNEKIDRLSKENKELQEANTKLQIELIEIIKR